MDWTLARALPGGGGDDIYKAKAKFIYEQAI